MTTRGVERLPEIRWGVDGLVPAIVQDVADLRVLMLGYVDAEALAATLEMAEVHFHSRSRDRLWKKGETSGNVLRLRDVSVDCDADALLFMVEPAGPTCHRGTRSCFDREDDASIGGFPSSGSEAAGPSGAQGFVWLETLWATVVDRAKRLPEGSYTASLVRGGVDAVGRKVTEEATEVLLAAKDDAATQAADGDRSATHDALAGEAADLLYHALVLLAERGLPASAVIERLRERHAG